MVIILSVALVSATVAVHAAGTTLWIRHLATHRNAAASGPANTARILIETALVLILLHALEIMIWAMTFRVLAGDVLTSLEEALYFSFATFTTLGYGDIVLSPPWRILTGIEALNGVLLLGWSTALSFAVIQAVMPKPDEKE